MAFSSMRFWCSAACIYSLASATATLPPNILWIVVDDLGWADPGFQNGHQIKTPSIDSLAREGTVLENYYVTPSCSPTRAAFMTGRYPIHTGISSAITLRKPVGLPLNETTVAQLLKKRGYKTHAVGKWHLGALSYYHTPTFRGFQDFYGFYMGSEDYLTHETAGGFDLRRDRREFCGRGCSHLAIEDRGNYSTELFTAEAVHVIKHHPAKHPLFLYLAYQAVHFPGQVPTKYSQPYEASFPGQPKRHLFAGMLTALDEGIGEVLSALRSRNMLESTFTIFTTDNGGPVRRGSSNFPLRGTKGELWEGGSRGLGIVRGPGLAEPGSLYPGLVHAVDWLPTLLGMTGQPVEEEETFPLDGVDLFNSAGWSVRSEIYYGTTDKAFATMRGPALRKGDLKLVLRGAEGDPTPAEDYEKMSVQVSFDRSPTAPLGALYNLSADPSEKVNIAREHPDLVSILLKKMADMQRKAVTLVGFVGPNFTDARCPRPLRLVAVDGPRGSNVTSWDPHCDAVYASEAPPGMPDFDSEIPWVYPGNGENPEANSTRVKQPPIGKNGRQLRGEAKKHWELQQKQLEGNMVHSRDSGDDMDVSNDDGMVEDQPRMAPVRRHSTSNFKARKAEEP